MATHQLMQRFATSGQGSILLTIHESVFHFNKYCLTASSAAKKPDMVDKTKRLARWYYGGLGAAGATCFTHPLDLLKVQLQTQQEGSVSIVQLTKHIVSTQGFTALYNGLSASVFRQLTYSTIRFGIYEVTKQRLMASSGTETSFMTKILMAGVGGAAGGFAGTPPDVVNVRMQNDVKLPLDKRRNYKHVFDGFARVIKEEGFMRLFSGAAAATSRAAVMTIGQISFYDQIKLMAVESGYFGDHLGTHLMSSTAAGAIATSMTQPLDVLKTRTMNAKPGEFKGMLDVIMHTAKLGPLGFYKGYVPAFLRLAPQTILTFLIFEQLRIHFGVDPPPKAKA